MQSPQTSAGAAQPGAAEQFVSSQSTLPSQSLSEPSPHTSVVGVQAHSADSVCSQRPATQASVVQASPSLQSLTLPQDLQPGIATCPQLPSAWQTSAVQALWSSQSETVVQATQPSRSPWPQTPSALQESSVQASPSPQSVAEAQETQPGTLVWAQTPFSQVSVVQPLPSLQSPAVVHSGSRVVEVVLEVVEVLDVDVLEVDELLHVVDVLVVVVFLTVVLVVVVPWSQSSSWPEWSPNPKA